MCPPAIALGIAATAVSAVGAGASILQGAKASRVQQQAVDQAKTDAAATRAANERAVNQANAKRPNLAGLFNKNLGINSGGVGSTLLTGSQGTAAPMLGASTLLGR